MRFTSHEVQFADAVDEEFTIAEGSTEHASVLRAEATWTEFALGPTRPLPL